MHIGHLGTWRKMVGGLLAGIALVALSGCYPYYHGQGHGYYKQGHYSQKHHYGSGHYYHGSRGKYYKRSKHKRYRHYYRY